MLYSVVSGTPRFRKTGPWFDPIWLRMLNHDNDFKSLSGRSRSFRRFLKSIGISARLPRRVWVDQEMFTRFVDYEGNWRAGSSPASILSAPQPSPCKPAGGPRLFAREVGVHPHRSVMKRLHSMNDKLRSFGADRYVPSWYANLHGVPAWTIRPGPGRKLDFRHHVLRLLCRATYNYYVVVAPALRGFPVGCSAWAVRTSSADLVSHLLQQASSRHGMPWQAIAERLYRRLKDLLCHL